jgi:plastocyanin
LALLLVGATTGAVANTYIVTANADMTFTPSYLVIYQYDTVIFQNAGGLHNVHADNDAFICAINCTTKNAPSTQSWSVPVQFRHLGDFGYYCEAHGDLTSGMRGEIVVIDRVFVDGFETQTP